MEKVLEIKNLSVSLHTYAGEIKAIRNISFDLFPQETLVIVGESGCGKSMTSKAIIQLLPENIAETSKESVILFEGQNLTQLPEKTLKHIRGEKISMVFQDPTTYLNPTMTIGAQIGESLSLHKKLSKAEIRRQTIEILGKVKISNPEARLKQYPHEFSGGMRQRVMIAMALACRPKILIADEPTTALDVTTQADIMDLIKELQQNLGTAVILITHDLGIASEIGNRIQVMYAGEIIESGTKEQIFNSPAHPYTWALLRSVPTVSAAQSDRDGSYRLYSLPGTPPDLIAPPKACAFAERCEYCMDICQRVHPPVFEDEGGHLVSCWLCHPQAPKVEIPVKAKGVKNHG